jgi:hypothetical protein
MILGSPEAKAVDRVLSQRTGLGEEVDVAFFRICKTSRTILPRVNFEAKIAVLFDDPDQLAFGNENADQARDRFKRALERHRASLDASDLNAVRMGPSLPFTSARSWVSKPLIIQG